MPDTMGHRVAQLNQAQAHAVAALARRADERLRGSAREPARTRVAPATRLATPAPVRSGRAGVALTLQLLLQQLIQGRRIGLTAGGLHHLPHKEPEQLVLP
jgi:hypothetical protein